MGLAIIFTTLSLTLAGLSYWGMGLYREWGWIFLLPVLFAGFYVLCFATWLILLFIASLFVSKDENKIYPPNRFCQWIIRDTARQILFLLGAKTRVTGLGKIPKDEPIVLINNHLSVFDEFAIAAFFPQDYIFISKPGNFRMPIAGAFMRYAGYLPIKQDDMADGAKVISLAASYIKDKKFSVCVAPEGTRNKNFPEPLILPFHAGTFRLGLESGAPIVTVAIQNTNLIVKRFPFHRTQIYLDVVSVMEKSEYETLSSREIAQRSRDAIIKRFDHKMARFYHLEPKESKEEKA